MSETKQITTSTVVTIVGSSLRIFTRFIGGVVETVLNFFIRDSDGIVNDVSFREGELGYYLEGYPSFGASLNDKGELIIVDEDTSIYEIDSMGHLIKTPSSRFTPPIDVDGVVTIDVTERGYLSTTKSPYVHALIHYGDYLYCGARYPEVGGVNNMIKIKTTNYFNNLFTEIRYSSNIDPQPIYMIEQLVRVSNYLYGIAWANVGGIQTNLMIQYNIIDDTYKIFKLPSTYGTMYSVPIFTDGTHLYVLANLISELDYTNNWTIIKYLASDFQDPSWPKYNTMYDENGVPITPVDTLELESVSGSYYGFHAATTDNTHAYLSFLNGDSGGLPSKLLKLQFSNFSIVDSANVPAASDDIANNDAYVFLGAEESEYEPTWTTVAVRKSDMAVTALVKHSTEEIGKASYGVSLGTLNRVQYLFNLRTDGKIYVIDISNPDLWSPLESADPYILRLIRFVFSDAPIEHNIRPNELIVDNNETLHVALWGGTRTELVQFKLASLI